MPRKITGAAPRAAAASPLALAAAPLALVAAATLLLGALSQGGRPAAALSEPPPATRQAPSPAGTPPPWVAEKVRRAQAAAEAYGAAYGERQRLAAEQYRAAMQGAPPPSGI